MIATVFKAENVYLLNEEPEWGSAPPECDFTMFRDTQAGLTHHEARRPYNATLLTVMRYSSVVQDGKARALQGALRTITTEPVIVPFWPGIWYWSDRVNAPIKGGLMIAWKHGWADWALYATGDVEPAPMSGAWDFWAPALYGFLKPKFAPVLKPSAPWFDVEFTESSKADYALNPPAFAMANGPQPAGYGAALPLMPFFPLLGTIEEETSVTVNRDQVGFTREQGVTFYPHAAETGQHGDYALQDSEIGQMLRIFLDVLGPGGPFWAPSGVAVSDFSANVTAGDVVLNVDDNAGVKAGDYLAVIAPRSSGIGPAFAMVNTLGAGVLNLTGPLKYSTGTNAAAASGTPLFRLCLARLDAPKLTVSWQRPGFATVKLEWTELPAEVLAGGLANETIGTTIGLLPKRVQLLEFSRDFGGGNVVYYRYTSWEKDIVYSGNNFSGGKLGNFGVGEITKGLNLESDVTQVNSLWFAGNPIVDEVANVSEAPLSLVIYFADYDGVTLSNVQKVFTGDGTSGERDGNKFIGKCTPGPALFDTMFPRMVRGLVCSHLSGTNSDGSFLISAGCTLLKADWKFTGLVANPISSAYPFTLKLSTLTGVGANAIAALAANAVFANWFLNGYVEWLPGGDPTKIQKRLIIGSAAPVAGALNVTLHRYFSGGPPLLGDTISLYPGCDGIYTTCKAYDPATNATGKFGNDVNYGAEPFTPIINPSMKGLLQQKISGGKK